jgi:hypothetical protein
MNFVKLLLPTINAEIEIPESVCDGIRQIPPHSPGYETRVLKILADELKKALTLPGIRFHSQQMEIQPEERFLPDPLLSELQNMNCINGLKWEEQPVDTIEGIKYIGELEEGENFVSMLVHQNAVYVASNRRVFTVANDHLEELQFTPKL